MKVEMEKIVLDLGMHNGDDTDFYLKKGFKVVAVEANPLLTQEARARFSDALAQDRLRIFNKAIAEVAGTIEFYIHPTKSDWSSCSKTMAESDGSRAQRISIESTTLEGIFAEVGTPYYMKVDIEGFDTAVASQLFYIKNKPRHVSFEISKANFGGIFAWLYVSGYSSFQFVNQMLNSERSLPLKQAEGDTISYAFTKYSSGSFGDDLPHEKWLSYEDALTYYTKYRELKFADNKELAVGWLDVHARLAE